MAAECQPCVEAANANYTLRTGTLTVCLESDGVVRDLGNVSELAFRFEPEFLEHFNGATGELDAKIPIRSRFYIDVTLEEITPANLAVLLGQTQTPNTPSGCIIPIRGPQGCASQTASIEFVHTFACGDKTLTIRLWRAVIGAASTMTFGGDEFVNIPLTFEALSCESIHPDSPLGELEFSENCVLS